MLFFLNINLTASGYIGWDIAPISNNFLAINSMEFHTLLYNLAKHFLKSRTGIPLTGSGFGKCRMIRYSIMQWKSTEPTVCQIQLKFFNETTVGLDTMQLSNQQHLKHPDQFNGRPSIDRIIRRESIINKIKGYQTMNVLQKVIVDTKSSKEININCCCCICHPIIFIFSHLFLSYYTMNNSWEVFCQ